jgi:heterodisulfide reductase subunit A
MVSVGQHEYVNLMTYSEVVDVSGYVGNFKVRIRKKARYVDPDRCTGCGTCWSQCPATTRPVRRLIKKDELIINRPPG